MYRFRTDPAENEECQKNDEAEKARVSMGKTLFIEDPKRLRQCSEVVEVNNGAWDETVLYQATQFRALGYMFQWVGANFRVQRAKFSVADTNGPEPYCSGDGVTSRPRPLCHCSVDDFVISP